MNSAIVKTDFSFPGQKSKYEGKVRDVYRIEDYLVMVVSDRISAFDVILPKGIFHRPEQFAPRNIDQIQR